MLPDELTAILRGDHSSPFAELGPQRVPGGWRFRTFQPKAERVDLIDAGPMTRLADEGLFEIELAEPLDNWRVEVTNHEGHSWEILDPYSFRPQLSDFDLHLLGEGTLIRGHETFGAKVQHRNGVPGVRFAVWAPNAKRVSVVGPFNHWDGRCHPMQLRGGSGVWELFIPELVKGELYKFEVKGADGQVVEKADPYGFAAEIRPATASMVWQHDDYQWQDQDWMEKRKSLKAADEPISVYEVHLGSWRRGEDNAFLDYDSLAEQLIPYVQWLGFTHLELLPISEHPLDASWGYQTIGYFAPTSRFGNPDDFKRFVDRCHTAGLGVIIDWVPAHFPKDAHGLGFFDGTPLYEHADPRKGEHRDWGTLIFNYGRNEVKSFLMSNAIFWAEVYHVDGFRVDAVASMLYLDYSREADDWIPNEHGGNENYDAVAFLKEFNERIHGEFPGILTFAEESTSWPAVSRPTYDGGLGFGLKWNMGWMNDNLEYFELEPVHRAFHHYKITFSLLYAFSENFILPFSHDEVVHGKGSMLDKMPGDVWQKFANLRLLYTWMFAHPGKKLLFMGCEFGQWNEWNFDQSLDWHLADNGQHQQLMLCVKDLNRLYAEHPVLHTRDFSGEGFQWLDANDNEAGVLSFMRWAEDGSCAIVILNLTPVVREGYRVGAPHVGPWGNVFNSDSEFYGGSNIGPPFPLTAEEQPSQGQDHSFMVDLPPLGALVLMA